jgi:membrane protein
MKIKSKIQSFYKNTDTYKNFSSQEGKIYSLYLFFNKYYIILKDFIERIDRHNIFMLSSGIAFNIFIYFIPLVLIAIFLTVKFMNFNTIDNSIENIMIEFLPDTENTHIMIYEVLNEITTIREGSSASGIVGFISLLWVSSLFISALRSGLDRILEIKARKVFIFYRLKDILITLTFPIIVFIYSISIPFITYLFDFFPDFSGIINKQTLIGWSISLFSFLFTFILFFFIYKFIPSEKQEQRKAKVAAIFGGFFVLIARWIFSYYVVSISNYSTFYGAYAVIISIAIWVYYFSFILLFSAELSYFFKPKFFRSKQKNEFSEKD